MAQPLKLKKLSSSGQSSTQSKAQSTNNVPVKLQKQSTSNPSQNIAPTTTTSTATLTPKSTASKTTAAVKDVGFKDIGKGAAYALRSEAGKSNDLSSQVLSESVTVAKTSAVTMKAAQAASAVGVDTAGKTLKTGANAAKVTAKGAVKVVRGGVEGYKKLKSGQIKLNMQTVHTLKTRAITNVKKRVTSAYRGIRRKILKSAVGRGIRITRGIAAGKIALSTVAKNTLVQSAKATGRFALNQVQATPKRFLKTIKTSAKGYMGLTKFAGAAALSSNDTSVQVIGVGAETAHYAPKVLKSSAKAGAKTAKFGYKTIKTSVRAGKRVYIGGKFLKSNGVKKSAAFAAKKTGKALKKTGIKATRKLAKVLLEAGKNLLMKLLIPILLIVAVTAGMMGAVAAPVAAVGSIFGGVLSIFGFGGDNSKSQEVDIDKLLTDKINTKRKVMIDNIVSTAQTSLVSVGGNYHYVRYGKKAGTDFTVYSEVKTGDSLDGFRGALETKIPATAAYLSMLQPVFTAKMLDQYGLEPTQDQVNSSFDEIWDKYNIVKTEELPTEYCGNTCEYCGNVHANTGCPNFTSGTHSTFTCDICDSYESDGDGNETFVCGGYKHCQGHKILGVTIDTDGLDRLMNDYFYKPIEELASKPARTKEEDEKLQNLKDNLDICLILHNELNGGGTGAGGTDLSGVNFQPDGTRAGYQAIVDLAEQQIGNVGGYPYWHDLGYETRIEWCAAFVSWCAMRLNVPADAFQTFVSCSAGVDFFKNKGQWNAGFYDKPIAGDLIFFDWEGDGVVDHVGLVAGNDGTYVYTIEGNSGDACRARKYTLSSSVIFGYAFPSYTN
jgi:hypothetical protein